VQVAIDSNPLHCWLALHLHAGRVALELCVLHSHKKGPLVLLPAATKTTGILLQSQQQ
jgi:hypothetical protein